MEIEGERERERDKDRRQTLSLKCKSFVKIFAGKKKYEHPPRKKKNSLFPYS